MISFCLCACAYVSNLPQEKIQEKDFLGGGFHGTVMKKGKDSIEVDGKAIQPIAPNYPTGTWSFMLDGVLSAGKSREGLHPGESYRLEDIKIGDLVDIDFDRINGVKFCTMIAIRKRPGGRVPPSPNEEDDRKNERVLGYRYHEGKNAYWDFEEKGTPYPEKFRVLRRYHIAPMPREVKR